MGYSKYVYLLLAFTLLLFVTFFVRDWIVLYQCGAVDSCLKSSSHYQHIAKFIVPILAAAITLFIGKRSICTRDRLLLQAAFLMIICADFCFKILHNYFIPYEENQGEFISFGIIFFMLAQLLFIYRHTRISDTDHTFPWILFFPFAVSISAAVLLMFHIYDSIMLFAVISYGPFLFCSLYAAWKTLKNKYFPKRNARLIKRGLICFTCCDLLTGLSLMTGADHSACEIVAIVSNNFIWCLYTPALIFLALSGFRHTD